MSQYEFRLYVAGDSPRSLQAVENLRRLCEELGIDDPSIAVIDVLLRPDVAEEDRILTTPTLVRTDPLRRVTGDLSDRVAVMRALTLDARASRAHPGSEP